MKLNILHRLGADSLCKCVYVNSLLRGVTLQRSESGVLIENEVKSSSLS